MTNTDALVRDLRGMAALTNGFLATCARGADLIEQQAAEIERLNGMLAGEIKQHGQALCALSEARAALSEAQRDVERINLIASEYLKIDTFEIPTGAGDADVGWRISQYYMAAPKQRIVAEVFHDNLRDAIDIILERKT